MLKGLLVFTDKWASKGHKNFTEWQVNIINPYYKASGLFLNNRNTKWLPSFLNILLEKYKIQGVQISSNPLNPKKWEDTWV